MVKGILFDMDGVLFDSERVGQTIFRELTTAQGYPSSDSFFYRLLGNNLERDRVICLSEYGEGFPFDEDFTEMWNRRRALAMSGKIPLKSGAAALLDWLRKTEIPRAIVSGTDRELIEAYLDSVWGMRECFPVIISGDMGYRSKPDPEPYLRAAEALGLSPEDCLGVEDSLNGIMSLRKAGVTSVCIPDLIPWGDAFLPFTDHYLPDLYALPPLVERLNRGGCFKA